MTPTPPRSKSVPRPSPRSLALDNSNTHSILRSCLRKAICRCVWCKVPLGGATHGSTLTIIASRFTLPLIQISSPCCRGWLSCQLFQSRSCLRSVRHRSLHFSLSLIFLSKTLSPWRTPSGPLTTQLCPCLVCNTITMKVLKTEIHPPKGRKPEKRAVNG